MKAGLIIGILLFLVVGLPIVGLGLRVLSLPGEKMIKGLVLAVAVLLALVSPAKAQGGPSMFVWSPSVVDATHDPPTSYNVRCGRVLGGPYDFVAAGTFAFNTSMPISMVLSAAPGALTATTAPVAITDTSILVTSTAGFTPSGAAYLGGLRFSYTGVTATSFTGVSGLTQAFPTATAVQYAYPCVVTAVNRAQETAPSNEVTVPWPALTPNPPTGFGTSP